MAMWLCGYAVMHLCGYIAVWQFGYVAMWICGYLALWLRGYVGVCLYDYPELRAHPPVGGRLWMSRPHMAINRYLMVL